MSLVIVKGNIWNTKHRVLVNTVNCEGVMGAGIALESALRFPKMYERYKKICEDGMFNVGSLWIYKDSNPYWVLNFPTKQYWKLPSKMQYLESGLKKFVDTYKEKEIESIAFPVLGASNGGLDEKAVLELMYTYLGNLDIPVEIYMHDPKAPDEYFGEFKELLLNNNLDDLVIKTKIQKKYLEIIIEKIKQDESICQIIQLKGIKNIGNSTIRKIFLYKDNSTKFEQQVFNF